jgi:hypothetical protein
MIVLFVKKKAVNPLQAIHEFRNVFSLAAGPQKKMEMIWQNTIT